MDLEIRDVKAPHERGRTGQVRGLKRVRLFPARPETRGAYEAVTDVRDGHHRGSLVAEGCTELPNLPCKSTRNRIYRLLTHYEPSEGMTPRRLLNLFA